MENDRPAIDFEQLTPAEQRIMLLTRTMTARLRFEEVAQTPDSSPEDYEAARVNKQRADQAFLDFQIAHGEIPAEPPEET